MTEKKIDFKKEEKKFYAPKRKPERIFVPEMNFLMVDGKGDPDGEEYQKAVQSLYTIAYTIKMSKMGETRLDGYTDFVVPPLEGFWWSEGKFDLQDRDAWLWTSILRQPDFVTEEVLEWAKEVAKKKKPDVDTSRVKLVRFEEGECVQMMHIGPFSEEVKTVAEMHQFMETEGLRNDTGAVRKHHEIYLSDPRKADPEKMKTILRLPVS
ncbi:GyrI-like domain-containing protein [Listeria monocytogenes]|uniref:GyrI-like domain-containing protein n=1 Tax=Listeria monocytogenes TaxID=1639 RepID=UPI00087391E0|nr:GyrI-like domain-containing protein [Listeria monocytogenes]EAC6409890.1 transcriptional regulator [Listeria monocytogenes]EAD5763334.1 transcriptional regulator [Listeria monocytogenes]EGP9129104.1 transcriptional regulator [Listeria monocytogenes]EHN0472293.1 GyrI-like domain-containing protein [Listeria monocytogenes]EIZ1103200.1 GyrI-like domain-containing protein [Listeria monocytogenes]